MSAVGVLGAESLLRKVWGQGFTVHPGQFNSLTVWGLGLHVKALGLGLSMVEC